MYGSVRAVLGPKWTLEILALLQDEGTLNYSDVEDQIDTSSDIVTGRLQTLREHSLVERVERSSRDVRYSITDNGRRVLDCVNEIDAILSD